MSIWSAILTALFVIVAVEVRERFRVWQAARATPRPTVAEVVTSVHQACMAVGLPGDLLTPTYDLARTGKLYEVLEGASRRLNKDHELRTIQDIYDWLGEAPPIR